MKQSVLDILVQLYPEYTRAEIVKMVEEYDRKKYRPKVSYPKMTVVLGPF